MFELKNTFLDDCLKGDALLEDIDIYINRWNNSSDKNKSIHQYLGFTKEEYELWYKNPSLLKSICFAHKNNITISSLINESKKERLVTRASSIEEANKILSWLKETGRIL